MKHKIIDVIMVRSSGVIPASIRVKVEGEEEWLNFDATDLIGLNMHSNIYIKRIRKYFKLLHTRARVCRHKRKKEEDLFTNSLVLRTPYGQRNEYRQNAKKIVRCLDCKKILSSRNYWERNNDFIQGE